MCPLPQRGALSLQRNAEPREKPSASLLVTVTLNVLSLQIVDRWLP